MTPGLTASLQHVNEARKAAVINNELLRLQVDIAAFQETRLAGSGKLKEKDYTFFWQGNSFELICPSMMLDIMLRSSAITSHGRSACGRTNGAFTQLEESRRTAKTNFPSSK